MSAIGRSVLYEILFEGNAVMIAENPGETPKDKSQNGFNQSITRIAADLTGQPMTAERSFLQKLKLRKG